MTIEQAKAEMKANGSVCADCKHAHITIEGSDNNVVASCQAVKEQFLSYAPSLHSENVTACNKKVLDKRES